MSLLPCCRTSPRWSAIYCAWSVELIGRCHPEPADRIVLRHVHQAAIPGLAMRRRRLDSPWAVRSPRQPARWQTAGRAQRRSVLTILPERFLAYTLRQRFYLLFTYKTVLSIETTAETRQDRLWDAYLYVEDVNGGCYSPLGYIFIAIFARVFVSDLARKNTCRQYIILFR